MNGGVVDLAGEDGVVVALGHDELQGVIAAAHIVHAGQLDHHAFICSSYCPFFNLGAGAGASQKAAVAGSGNGEVILAVTGGTAKLQKVIVSDIQGQVNIVALDDFGIGRHLIGGGAGVLGILFVVGGVLVVHLPVIAAAADSVQLETIGGLFAAQRALGLKYGGNGCVVGQGDLAAIVNGCFGAIVSHLVGGAYKFIAGTGFKFNSDFSTTFNSGLSRSAGS